MTKNSHKNKLQQKRITDFAVIIGQTHSWQKVNTYLGTEMAFRGTN